MAKSDRKSQYLVFLSVVNPPTLFSKLKTDNMRSKIFKKSWDSFLKNTETEIVVNIILIGPRKHVNTRAANLNALRHKHYNLVAFNAQGHDKVNLKVVKGYGGKDSYTNGKCETFVFHIY